MDLQKDCTEVRTLVQRIICSLDVENPELAATRTTFDNLLALVDSPLFTQLLSIQNSCKRLDSISAQQNLQPQDFDIDPSSGQLILHNGKNLTSFEHDAPSEIHQSTALVHSNHAVNDNGTDLAEKITTERITPVKLTNVQIEKNLTHDPNLSFQMAIERLAAGRNVQVLSLMRPENESFGFGISRQPVGEGQDEGGIFIRNIQPGKVAARDGRLQENDQILAINGHILDAKASNNQAVELLQNSKGSVELVIARDHDSNVSEISSRSINHSRENLPTFNSFNAQPAAVAESDWIQIEVIDLINDGSGLGFGIVGGKGTGGVTVKTILPGGVSDRDGRMRSGDHIIQIGGTDVRGMSIEQVADILRQLGENVCLIVARSTTNTTASPHTGTGLPLVATVPTNRFEEQLAAMNAMLDRRRTNSVERRVEAVASTSNKMTLGNDSAIMISNEEALQSFDVELTKDTAGLGITIAGYVHPSDGMPRIIVGGITPDSVAARDGRILKNDQIVAVDDISLNGFSNEKALDVLRNTGQIVKLTLLRNPFATPFESLARGTHTDASLTSAADASMTYWNSVLGSEYQTIIAELTKFKEGGGLGISLAGTKNLTDGEEGMLHHCVDTILPEGPVGRNGILAVGDELLEHQLSTPLSESVGELLYLPTIQSASISNQQALYSGPADGVNGQKLLGLDHKEVVSIIRDLPLDVRLICARRHTPPVMITTQTSITSSQLESFNTNSPDIQELPPYTGDNRLIKSRSEQLLLGSSAAVALSSATAADVEHKSAERQRSKSLEPLDRFTMWETEPRLLELEKTDKGLGFSILDYPDPLNPEVTMIIIRSLVPGGVAQADGRLQPGYRLISVNNTQLHNARLEEAVQALKGAPLGRVVLGVVPPLRPSPDSEISPDNLKVLSNGFDHKKKSTEDDDEQYSNNALSALAMSPLVYSDSSASEKDVKQNEDKVKNMPDALSNTSESGYNDSSYALQPLSPLSTTFLTSSSSSAVVSSLSISSSRAPDTPVVASKVSSIMIPALLGGEGGDQKVWGPPRLVEIHRIEGQSLGISIMGGVAGLGANESADGASEVFIKHILANSAASVTSLHPGDRILEVDDEDLRGASHEMVVDAIKRSSNPVRLLVQTPLDLAQIHEAAQPASNMLDGEGSKSNKALSVTINSSVKADEMERIARRYGDMEGEIYAVDIDQAPSSGSLGLCLAGNRHLETMSVFVIGIQPGSPVERQGGIRVGDELLEVNEHVLYGRSHLNASAIIKSVTSQKVRFIILRRKDYHEHIAVQPSSPSAPTSPNLNMNSNVEASRKIDPADFMSSQQSVQPMIKKSVFSIISDQLNGNISESDVINIEMLKGSHGLGFAIEESTSSLTNKSGIFIKSITPEGLAAEDGRLRAGDELLAVNDSSLISSSHQQALTVLRSVPPQSTVLLVIYRNDPSQTTASLHADSNMPLDNEATAVLTAVAADNIPVQHNTSPVYVSSPANHSSPTNQQNTSIQLSPAPVSVSPNPRPSNISLPLTIEPEAHNSDPATCPIVPGREICIAITKGKSGLGLSLVGGSDTLLGAVIIHEIYEGGAAARDGRLWAGDQIMEVNGTDLRDATHDDAIQTLRMTPSVVRMTVFRDDSLLRENLDDAYELITVPLIKKPGRGLGFSIIGRSSLVEQENLDNNRESQSDDRLALRGIYISDFVKGGVADSDGRLLRGDQIVSINDDDVRDATQERVAEILKTCMGTVSITVSRLKAGSLHRNARKQKSSELSTPSDILEVELSRNERGLLGVMLEGGASNGSHSPLVITDLQGSADCKIQLNDKILSINNKSTEQMSPADALSLIKTYPDKVVLRLQRDVTSVDLMHDLNKNHEDNEDRDYREIGIELEGDQIKKIKLEKTEPSGLGFSIVGGHGSAHGNLPIYVKSVFPEGPAAREGQLRRGDQILSVNGISLEGLTHDESVHILKEAKGIVIITALG